MNNRSQWPASGGFGLIEVMISITISLVVILAVTSLYLSQKSIYSTQGALSRVQENARYLMQMLTHDVRLSGYRDLNATTTFPSDPITGKAWFITGQNDTATGFNYSDALTLRFFGSSDTSGNPDGNIRDCTGTAIGINTQVIQTYRVAQVGTTNEPALFCNNDPTKPAALGVALVSGVESMQILYVIDVAGGGSLFSYQPADATNINNATSLLISVVLRSPIGNEPRDATAQVINHFGSTYAPGNSAPTTDAHSVYTPLNDGRLRKHFTFSVALRNRLERQ